MVLRNIWGMEFRQDGYLLYNILNFIFRVLNVDDLDRYRLPTPSVDTMKELACLKSYISGTTYPLYTFPKLPPPTDMSAHGVRKLARPFYQCNFASCIESPGQLSRS